MGGRFANLPQPRSPAANWQSASAERGYPTRRPATDATPVIIAIVTVGATIVLAVSGAAWRLGSRLGAVEHGLAGCESDIRELRTEMRTDIRELRTEVRTDIRDLNGKVDRILERLPPPPA